MARTVKKGRDAETGRFIPIQQALDNPRTTVIETIKVGPVKRKPTNHLHYYTHIVHRR